VELERATGGVVNRSYVTNLRKGRIENPGMDKLSALTRRWAFPRSLVRGGAARHGSRSFGGTRRALGQGRMPVRNRPAPEDGGGLHQRRHRPQEPVRAHRREHRGNQERHRHGYTFEPRRRAGEGVRRRALLPGGRRRGGAHRQGGGPGLGRRNDPGDRAGVRSPTPEVTGDRPWYSVAVRGHRHERDRTELVARSANRPADRP
jgi:hypothetical protein